MTHRKTRRIWYLILGGFAAMALISGLIALQPYGTPLSRLVRGAAALGYSAIFLAIISSNYMRQLVRFFGRPFVQIHHILSVTGLVMVTLHPLGAAWFNMSLRVWLPRLDSWLTFLEWGGPPAWYLIAIASSAAVLRKAIGQNWRVLHLLNYVAFFLGTVHASLIGTDFQHPIVRAVSVALALAVLATLIRKRFQRRRR
jgi:sulfoxide reductase heme-binding subunit YedZ